ncbi:MAG TPA: helix-turn-helix domain-containing protein [Ktedonobacteraceae bacterium]
MDEYCDLGPIEYQALAEFRYQLRGFLSFSEQAARAGGLEPQQHQLLLALKGAQRQEKVTIGDLAERLKIQHHSTVELINRMVERDLVQRCRDEQDQRRVLVVLTRHGEEVLRRLSLLHRTELRLTGPALVQALQAIIGKTPIEEGEKE